MIHALRVQYPNTPILLGKYDMDGAYRRIHSQLTEAKLCFTTIDRLAFLLTRLPFGTTPAADCFNTISESTTDLSQSIAEDKTWNPSILRSNVSHKIPPASIPDKVNNLQESPFHLTIPIAPKPIYHDVYIDDIIAICLAIKKYIERTRQATPLAIHSIFRPTDINDKVPRNNVLCMRKLSGEGALEERKTILGWLIDTRLFKIFLHPHKLLLWSKSIDNLISKKKKVHEKELESTLGKANHAGFIIPLL